MHIENELVEYVTPVDQEYEEIVEEYEEEVLVQEEFPEPPVTDTLTLSYLRQAPVHDPYFANHYIYLLCIYIVGIIWRPHANIYIYL
jgi:hypothetical protein